MFGYEDDERYDLERAAWAGNGCIYCLSTTHVATAQGCPRELEELEAVYCKYGHYEEGNEFLPECINELTAEGDPRVTDEPD